MAKTSLLDPAGPITGAETIPLVQDGHMVRANMADYAAAIAAPTLEAITDPGVQAVATNIAGVNTVAGISAQISTLADISANITLVAGIASAVSTAAGISVAITTVSSNTANINTVAADLALSGASLIAQAANMYAASYLAPNSVGDRRLTMTCTLSAGLSTTTDGSSLIDGVTGSGGLTPTAGLAVAGHTITLDKLVGANDICTEIKVHASNSATRGNWTVEASINGVDWTQVCAATALGGATVVTLTLTGNVSNRLLRLVGASGSIAASSQGTIREIELKLVKTVATGIRSLPKEEGTGQSLRTGPKGPVFETIFCPYRTGLLAEHPFDEGHGTRARDVHGGYHIDFDSSYQAAQTSTPLWCADGIRLELDKIETATIPGVRTQVSLVWVQEELTTGFIQAFSAAGGVGISSQQIITTADWSTYVGLNGVRPVRSASNGTGAKQLNRGYWYVLFVERAAAVDTKILFGAHPTQPANSTYRCPNMKVGYSLTFGGQLGDAGRAAVFDYLRGISMKRGNPLHWQDCADWQWVIDYDGQSNGLGRAALSDLPGIDTASYNALLASWVGSPGAASDLQKQLAAKMATTALRDFPNVEIMGGYSNALANKRLEPLQIGRNHHSENPTTEFGPVVHLAAAYENMRATRRRKLAISLTCEGGTRLALSSVSPAASKPTWHPDEVVGSFSDKFGASCEAYWNCEAQLFARGIGPRPAATIFDQGESDAMDTALSSIYQTNLGTYWAAKKLYTGSPFMVLCKIRDQSPTFNATAAAGVRSAAVAWDGANADGATVDNDGASLSADLIHYDAPGQAYRAPNILAAIPFS